MRLGFDSAVHSLRLSVITSCLIYISLNCIGIFWWNWFLCSPYHDNGSLEGKFMLYSWFSPR